MPRRLTASPLVIIGLKLKVKFALSLARLPAHLLDFEQAGELTRGAQTPGPVVDLGQLTEDSFSTDRKLREADSIDIFGRHHFRNENEVRPP